MKIYLSFFGCVLAAAALVLTSGCIERRLTINTQPQGAIVLLNDEEIGVSPVTVNFNWYGDYRIQLQKEGHEILSTHRQLKAPLHDSMPFDFFFGVLWPGRIVDTYEWAFDLTPYQPADRETLIRDALKIEQKAAEKPLDARLPK